MDCVSLKRAELCDICDEACGSVGEGRKFVRLRMDDRKDMGRFLEAREVREGCDLIEMIAEVRGGCMVCFFTEMVESWRHRLQRCRYVSRNEGTIVMERGRVVAVESSVTFYEIR